MCLFLSRGHGQPRVNLSEFVSEEFQFGRLDGAGLEELIELVFMGELTHPDGILDRRPGALDLRVVGTHGDRADSEVELGRKVAIEANLFLTQELPALERALIDKGMVDRPLDLV